MKRLGLFLSLTCLSTFVAFGQNGASATINFPHVVNGTFGDLSMHTVVTVTNPSSSAVSYRVLCADDSGRDINGRYVIVGGAPRADNVTIDLVGGATSYSQTIRTDPAFSGSCQVAASGPVIAQAIFEVFNNVTGQTVSLVGVSPSRGMNTFAFQVIQSFNISAGMAVMSLSANGGIVSLALYRMNGDLVDRKSLGVAGFGHFARFVDELFPGLPANFLGYVRVTSDVPVGVMALDLVGGLFASSPVFDLAAGAPAKAADTDAGERMPDAYAVIMVEDPLRLQSASLLRGVLATE